MRIAALALVGALGLAVSASANAAPFVPAPAGQDANIVQAAGGCGWGGHPNRWGRCVPNRYGYYRSGPRYYGPRYGYYGPRSWRSPSDNVANQLNRQELGRFYSGSSMPYYRGY